MILKAYYSGGRIDVFDTDHHVDAMPQKGNLLANYTLDLSDVAGDGLWLRSYYHGRMPIGRSRARRAFPWPEGATDGASSSPTPMIWIASTV